LPTQEEDDECSGSTDEPVAPEKSPCSTWSMKLLCFSGYIQSGKDQSCCRRAGLEPPGRARSEVSMIWANLEELGESVDSGEGFVELHKEINSYQRYLNDMFPLRTLKICFRLEHWQHRHTFMKSLML
jgi:hypothetical protein